MKNEKNISALRKAPVFRGLTGIITVLLLTVKLASPFLHTHQLTEPSSPSVNVSSLHCDACEYEATQAMESDAIIVLPENDFSQEIKVFEIVSPFLNTSLRSSESRGPPRIS